jgi:hypothetical protein
MTDCIPLCREFSDEVSSEIFKDLIHPESLPPSIGMKF